MAMLLAKTWFLSLSSCETPLDLAAGGQEVGLQPGEGKSVTALTLESIRASTLAQVLAPDSFLTSRVLCNQLKPILLDFPAITC